MYENRANFDATRWRDQDLGKGTSPLAKLD
ncbi:hypothetical protein PPSIR1_28671 [Plesiocystis pacifica SIR-1]|uniref:Uncharacterized protein n=1 Tax=Plesiocystis pacifica SIR-1 TaxID=391625 RepID=A6GHT0_9BACT|nr:hypothetical protein PPSIR1_28671 [Plesiocystis pacifica SIR-1]